MSNLELVLEAKKCLSQKIIGQEHLLERLFIALLANGHMLVEGAPGLAKTRAIKELSYLIEGDFHRVQFTPDLLPSDITGTEIFRPQDGSFVFQKGPVFHNLILADEINRSPAKVQSALLEAMGEKQVSVGPQTHSLPELFLVMATQNPIEQEGTYPLPEAQLDRFLMYVKVGYPNKESETSILRLTRKEDSENSHKVSHRQTKISQELIFAARKEILALHMADAVEEYIVELVLATREAKKYSDELASYLEYGASPRGTIALDRCSRARAWLNKKDFVAPEDVQAVAYDALRHRIGLSFEAEAKGLTPDSVISEILGYVAVP